MDTDTEQQSYNEISIKLTHQIDKKEKKNNGIFFTPPTTIFQNIELLTPYMVNVRTVLEPSCGSCEYVTALQKKFTNIEITGIELNETIFNSIRQLATTTLTLLNEDFLMWNTTQKFDLIIGNPPYFVTTKKSLHPEYYPYFDGRPNIYIPFLIKSTQLLNVNGILSFVLPKSFLNCLYYDKTRNYIVTHFEIMHIIAGTNDYLETNQDTIVLILRNSHNEHCKIKNKPFIFDVGEYTILGTPQKITQLKNLCSNSTTLSATGYTVNVGTVVWNQCKPLLTNDSTKTLLIYSADIKDNTLKVQSYANQEKKNYINKKGSTEPIIVVNRGYGMGNYKLGYCLIEGTDKEYLVENHLICIRLKTDTSIDNEQLIEGYRKILRSFDNEKTNKFIQLYFDNNAINTTEMLNIVPIYTDS